MSKPRVFIGIGHGGVDSGAIGVNNLKEDEIVLKIGKYVKEVLDRHGVLTRLSRYKDEADPLTEEIKEANSFRCDLAADLHLNSGGGDGAECYYSYKGGKSKTLAKNILNELKKSGQNLRIGTSGKKDGLKIKKNEQGQDYFGFVREVKNGVIVESAFIDNKTDIKILDTAAEQKKIAIAIAKGFLKTLKIKYKAEVVKTYTVIVGEEYKSKAQAENLVKKLKKAGFKAKIK